MCLYPPIPVMLWHLPMKTLLTGVQCGGAACQLCFRPTAVNTIVCQVPGRDALVELGC